MFELCRVHDFVVDIVDRQEDRDAAGVEDGEELVLVSAVAFARESFDAVAVDGMVEFALGGGDEHFAGNAGWVDGDPVDAIGEGHELVAMGVEVVDKGTAAEPFGFWEAAGGGGCVAARAHALVSFFSASMRAFSAARSARRAAARAFFSSMRCL